MKLTQVLSAGRFYGRARAHYDAGGVLLSEVAHERARELPLHGHQRAFFSLLLSGSYEEQAAGRTLAYAPGTLGFHPPALTHRDRIGPDGGRFFTVELEPAWLDRVRELQPVSWAPALLPGAPSWLAGRLYRECTWPRPGSALAVEALVLELLVEAGRIRCDARRRPEWLGRVHEALRSEPFRRWTLAALSKQVGVHAVHLSRAFRRFEGRSVGDLAREVRIHAAARLLSEAAVPLAEVALQAGFADQSHFTRVFRAVAGLTPAVWRRSFGRR